MTTVILDYSSLASAQSLAVNQTQKVLGKDGGSCINMSPLESFIPTPAVQTGC